MLPNNHASLHTITHYDYEVWQMDVKTAFLNSYDEEDIFIEQLKGFKFEESLKVCKFHRSIYGLKQASRSWNHRFDEAIHSYGFIRTKMSHVFTKGSVGASSLSRSCMLMTYF